MKYLWWLVAALPVILIIGALLLNQPHWLEPPGPWVRLKVYLTTHVAQTSDDSPFPELRTPHFALGCEQLHARLQQRMRALGWRLVESQPTLLRAQVVTPLLHFTDDVQVSLMPAGSGCRLQLRSTSRVGRADFGANQHHLMRLLDKLGPRAG